MWRLSLSPRERLAIKRAINLTLIGLKYFPNLFVFLIHYYAAYCTNTSIILHNFANFTRYVPSRNYGRCKKKKKEIYENANFFAGVDFVVVDNRIDSGRCHFRYYRRRGVISNVIGKASTVKGFTSAREPFRIFHISPGHRVARYFLKRLIRISGQSRRTASRRKHEKQNTKFIRITSNAHYQKRNQLYSHFSSA